MTQYLRSTTKLALLTGQFSLHIKIFDQNMCSRIFGARYKKALIIVLLSRIHLSRIEYWVLKPNYFYKLFKMSDKRYFQYIG